MIIQKLVLYHDGIMSDKRREQLNKTGHFYFKTSAKSKSLATSNDLTVPSDIHMYWEFYSQDRMEVERLSVILVGNPTAPDVSSYSKAKSIIFSGHICSMETALKMVSYLKACENVEFILGSQEQLPANAIRSRDELTSCTSVRSLKITTSVGKHSENTQDIKDTVLNQLETLFHRGSTMFPNLKCFTLDLPDDGKYLDLVKESLSKWSTIGQRYSIVVQESKILLVTKGGVQGRPKPFSVSCANETSKKKIVSSAKPDCHPTIPHSRAKRCAELNKNGFTRHNSLDCMSSCSAETEIDEIPETKVFAQSEEPKRVQLFDVQSGFGKFWGPLPQESTRNAVAQNSVEQRIQSSYEDSDSASLHVVQNRHSLRHFTEAPARKRCRNSTKENSQRLEDIQRLQRNGFYVPELKKKMVGPPPTLSPETFYSKVVEESQSACDVTSSRSSSTSPTEFVKEAQYKVYEEPAIDPLTFQLMFDRRPPPFLPCKENRFCESSGSVQSHPSHGMPPHPVRPVATTGGVIRLDLMFQDQQNQQGSRSSGLNYITANY